MPKKTYGDRRKPQQSEPTDNERRLRFEPAFLDFYNELVRPNVELRVPAYIWKWKPVLSKGAFVTYLRLRSMCFYDLKNRDNTRDWCWPKQSTLAKELGVSTRSLSDYLKELEKHQLIRRKANYEYDPRIGKRKRVEDTYSVPWELPLVAEDLATYSEHYAKELIEETLEVPEDKPDGSTGKNRRQVGEDAPSTYRQKLQIGHGPSVDNSAPIGKNRRASLSPARTAEQESIPEELTNVEQRSFKKASKERESGQTTLFDRPELRALTPDQIRGKEQRAYEIGERLKRIANDRSSEEHPYAAFHFKLACLLPQEAINYALDATQDAKDSGKLTKGASYHFVGVIKNKAKELGVDLQTQKEPKPLSESQN